MNKGEAKRLACKLAAGFIMDSYAISDAMPTDERECRLVMDAMDDIVAELRRRSGVNPS